MKNEVPKFTQITAGSYHDSKGKLSHVVYALSEDGRVYKDTRVGWVLVDDKKAARNASKSPEIDGF